MNFNQAKIISVYYNKGDRKPYDVNGKPIAYIGEEFIGSTEATTIRFYLGEDIDSSTATIVTKRADGERRLDICSKVGTGATSYYEVTLNEWYSAVKGKLVVVFKAYNGTVTFDDNENPTEILSVSGRIVVSDIFNLDIAYAPVADLVVPPDATEPYEDWFFALSTKLDKADSITVAGALPTLTGDAYDDRYFYIEDEGVGRLYYINGSTAIEVVFQVGTLKLTPTGNGNVSADTGKLSWEEEYGSVKLGLYDNNYLNIGQDLEYYGKADGAISKGDIIQFGTPEGNHFQIKKAVQSEINANPKLIMGIAKENIADNAFGYVLAFGRIRNINTSAYTIGDFLWFNSGGSTAGEWTTTQPTAPNAKILMAVVVKVDNNGIILVRPTIEPKLSELQDINITSIADNQILRWNSANSRWENSSELTTAETNISEILSGDQIVGKATNDKDGNAIDTTYLKVATATSTYVPLSSKGVANGVAPLGSDNKIPSIHLPGGVDDIKEFADLASFPLVGEASIIYVALDTNKIYRWGGSSYVEISSSLALGETSSTAFAGDRGVALETLTDNIVDGTQTLTDTKITNSAVGVVPLNINGINGSNTFLQRWQLNAVDKSYVNTQGTYIGNGVQSMSGPGAGLFIATFPTISTNLANSTTTLTVNNANASSTGDILRLQFAGANKLEITKDGFINQNGTVLLHTTGTDNVFLGSGVANLTLTGGQNSALGFQALQNNTTASSSVAIGMRSLRNSTSGGSNVALGRESGLSNTTGSANVFIGRDAGNNASQLASASNSTALGYQAYTDKSNQMVFGNSSVSEFVFNRNTSATALLPILNASSANLHTIETTTTASSSSFSVLRILATTSADMGDGFGGNLLFQVKDSANTTFSLANIGAIRSGGDTTGRLSLQTNNAGTLTEKMTIMPDGKVGIGTSAPVGQFSVSLPTTSQFDLANAPSNSINFGNISSGNAQPGIYTKSNGGVVGFYLIASSPDTNTISDIVFDVRKNDNTDFSTLTSKGFVFRRAGTELLGIRRDGLVGINETSPSAQLQVKSGATTRVPLVVDTLSGQTGALQLWRVNGTDLAGIYNNGRIFTNTGIGAASGSNALIEFGVGTTISRNVADTNPALIVNLANSSATGNIQVWQKAGSAKAYITNSGGFETSDRIALNIASSPEQEAIYVYDNVQDLFWVLDSGDVENVNGSYGTLSDVRLKENIVEARDYVEDLMKLRVVKYSLKTEHSDKPTHLGFIAQEVEQVFPGLVKTKKTEELEDQKSIKTSVLIPMLVKAIQEQQKQIDKLKAKIG